MNFDTELEKLQDLKNIQGQDFQTPGSFNGPGEMIYDSVKRKTYFRSTQADTSLAKRYFHKPIDQESLSSDFHAKLNFSG